MKQIKDYSDYRYKGTCIHCERSLTGIISNDDHVPSKVLLDQPLPANVHVVRTCLSCNNGFSSDEEYFAAFLGAAMCGSTDPSRQSFESARKTLSGNAKLRAEISAARVETSDANGDARLPDFERIHRVVIKNARGHVFHELGQPMTGEPDEITVVPLALLDEERLAKFLEVNTGACWPEVGSRQLQRYVEGTDMSHGWVIVQPEVYVFSVADAGAVTVRSIIREYLLTEVIWEV